MWSAEQQVEMQGHKVLAEMGTPAADNPETRVFPTGVNRSQALFWLGIIAAAILIGSFVWSLIFR